MAKHNWILARESQNKSKKKIYVCFNCHAQFVLKNNDTLNDDGIGCFQNISYSSEKNRINTYHFTGIIINESYIAHVVDGRFRREDGASNCLSKRFKIVFYKWRKNYKR